MASLTTPSSADFYFPEDFGKVETLKERFDKMNDFIQARNGWVTSIPGSSEIAFECLPTSSLPEQLIDANYLVEPAGEGQRILPAAIVETITVEGSTVPRTVRHAGIAKVLRFSFDL
jgi:hypothetical protein